MTALLAMPKQHEKLGHVSREQDNDNHSRSAYLAHIHLQKTHRLIPPTAVGGTPTEPFISLPTLVQLRDVQR